MTPTTAPTTTNGETPSAAPTLPGLAPDPVAALFDWAVAERASIHLIGPHGIGKTAYVAHLARRRGLRVVTKSLPVCSQRDFCIPVPVARPDGTRVIDTLVLDELLQRHPGDRYVLVLDELSRADSDTLNTAMELLQEHTLAGQPLPGLVAVVALDNPAHDAAYVGVASLDLAQADRVAALVVTADDIPWAAHLAAVHGLDLAPFVTAWRRLPTDHRRVLCPRVVDHLIAVVRAGLPPELALPVHGDGRERLLDRNGDDVTGTVLRDLVHHLGVVPAAIGADTTVAALAHAVTHGWNLRLVGAPGIGKTAHVRDAVAAAGLDLEYLSLSLASPQDLVIPVPVDGRLDFLPARRLVEPDRRYVLVLDEFSRAPEDVAAAAMELVNERTLAGRPLPGCVAIIALDNPPVLGALSFDAGRIDAAQASRFTATVEVGVDDLPWRDHLTDRFGAAAQPFVDWRAEDLDDALRALVSPRCLERMISLEQAGLDPALGLPVVGGDRVPVSTVALRRRLDGAGGLGLAAVVADLDATTAALAAGDTHAQIAVVTALQRADVTTLERHRPAVAALVAHLEPAHRLSLVRQGPRRQAFFVDVLSRGVTTEEVA